MEFDLKYLIEYNQQNHKLIIKSTTKSGVIFRKVEKKIKKWIDPSVDIRSHVFEIFDRTAEEYIPLGNKKQLIPNLSRIRVSPKTHNPAICVIAVQFIDKYGVTHEFDAEVDSYDDGSSVCLFTSFVKKCRDNCGQVFNMSYLEFEVFFYCCLPFVNQFFGQIFNEELKTYTELDYTNAFIEDGSRIRIKSVDFEALMDNMNVAEDVENTEDNQQINEWVTEEDDDEGFQVKISRKRSQTESTVGEQMDNNASGDSVLKEVKNIKKKKNKKTKPLPMEDMKTDTDFDAKFDTNVPKSCGQFKDMGLNRELFKGLTAIGLKKPSDLQKKAIVPLIEGSDAIIQSEPNEERTITYLLPVLQRIDTLLKSCQAVIVVSNQRHGEQVFQLLSKLSEFMSIKIHLCICGKDMKKEIRVLDMGPQIVIGTADKVVCVTSRNLLKTRFVKMFVVDRFDDIISKMSNQLTDVFQIVNIRVVQTIIASEQMTEQVLEMTTFFTVDPIQVVSDSRRQTLKKVKHSYIQTGKRELKIDILSELFTRSVFGGQTVVFCNTRQTVDRLRSKLDNSLIHVICIHDDMSSTRTRVALDALKTGLWPVLVTTENLAIDDIRHVTDVVNYDMPTNADHFWNRISVFKRNKDRVRVLNLVSREEMSALIDIQNTFGLEIEKLSTD